MFFNFFWKIIRKKQLLRKQITINQIEFIQRVHALPGDRNLNSSPVDFNLSRRESEIFKLLLTEQTIKEIAYSLQLSYSGVYFHVKNIYSKLGVQSRPELFVKFGKKGMINRIR